MELKYYGEQVLREKCQDVDESFDIKSAVQEMNRIMIANGGVGIAAPQVGLSKKIFIVRDGKHPRVFVNPEIITYSEQKKNSLEGCLSIPGFSDVVERSVSIEVKYLDESRVEKQESFHGFAAVVIQHEYDHLNGVLFIDHLPKEKFEKIQEKLNITQ